MSVDTSLLGLSLADVAEGLRERRFSSVELTSAMLKRVHAVDSKLGAYVLVTDEVALGHAKAADKILEKGEGTVLTGVPCALKDVFNTRGVRTTCCSKILKDFVPPYNATVVDRLENEGYVLLGKLNTDEFACGSSTENSCFGPTRNPWDLERVAGGSSGGPAAAVSADLAYYTLGTDTGGSIRLPASLCGVVGLKVTYGRVSRSGVTSLASSFDTIGPFAKTVKDTALVLNAIAGKDSRDATTPPVAVPDYSANLGSSVKGLTIGIPEEYFAGGLTQEVEEAVRKALQEYEKMGLKLKKVSLPYTKYALALYYITQSAELSANLARFDGIRYGSKPSVPVKDLVDYYYQVRTEGFGDEIKRRIMIGTYVLSAGYYDAYYKQAQKVRTLVIQDFERVFQEVDFLATPVAPSPAFKIGEKADDPLSMYLVDVYTLPASCAGVPALSLPCGFSAASKNAPGGLPIGLQLIGPQFREDLLLQAGAAYEQATDWHTRKPGV